MRILLECCTEMNSLYSKMLSYRKCNVTTVLHDIQRLPFLQISKIIIMQQLCRHFTKITGGQGQPGVINRAEMWCICAGWFF